MIPKDIAFLFIKCSFNSRFFLGIHKFSPNTGRIQVRLQNRVPLAAVLATLPIQQRVHTRFSSHSQ